MLLFINNFKLYIRIINELILHDGFITMFWGAIISISSNINIDGPTILNFLKME